MTEIIIIPSDDPNLKPPDPLLLQYLHIQFSASLNACFLPFLMLWYNANKRVGGYLTEEEEAGNLEG